jgi:hypothetical protein
VICASVWTRSHQIQINVRTLVERSEHLIEHLAVLAGHHDDGVERRARAQRPNDRQHLDALGPRAEHDHDKFARPASHIV